jgi:hypothetical protein
MRLYSRMCKIATLIVKGCKMLILLNQIFILAMELFGDYGITRYNHDLERR